MPTVEKRILDIRDHRRNQVVSNTYQPRELREGPKLVVQMIPVCHQKPLDLERLNRAILPLPDPTDEGAVNYYYNEDGLLAERSVNGVNGTLSYTQIFRDGSLLAVCVVGSQGVTEEEEYSIVSRDSIEEALLLTVGFKDDSYLQCSRSLGVEGGILVSVDLIGASGYQVVTRDPHSRGAFRLLASKSLRRDIIQLIEQSFFEKDGRMADEVVLNVVLDAVWQCGGDPKYAPSDDRRKAALASWKTKLSRLEA